MNKSEETKIRQNFSHFFKILRIFIKKQKDKIDTRNRNIKNEIRK